MAAEARGTLFSGHGALPGSYDADRLRVEACMKLFVEPHGPDVYALCGYHMGWTDVLGQPEKQAAGKMLRPTLCLATCRGYGDPQPAIGIAAAIELLHGFSLVHDDIEDGDAQRHGRPTLWTAVGLPLALNAGDSLFALAYRALVEGASSLSPARLQQALRLFSDACLRMIEGQHQDIEFEQRDAVTTAEYNEMARRKTGALIGASMALGALAGGAPEREVEQLEMAGVELGLAFQAVDDVLAIWGDPALTGKAVGNDLARGKKSLPVAIAIERGWSPVGDLSLEAIRTGLEALGVRDELQRFATLHAGVARRVVQECRLAESARTELNGLIDFVISRRS